MLLMKVRVYIGMLAWYMDKTSICWDYAEQGNVESTGQEVYIEVAGFLLYEAPCSKHQGG